MSYYFPHILTTVYKSVQHCLLYYHVLLIRHTKGLSLDNPCDDYLGAGVRMHKESNQDLMYNGVKLGNKTQGMSDRLRNW